MTRSDDAEMRLGRWSKRALRLVPWPWRQAVLRDLAEESAGRSSPARDLWAAWHLARIAGRFHGRHARRALSRARPLAGLWADFPLAYRALRREPGSTLAIAATLALGIGATTATYAVFNFVLFRPVPGVPDERPLVTVMFQPPDNLKMMAFGSQRGLPAMREAATTLDQLGFARPETVVVGTPGGQPTFEGAELASSQYFGALGVRARAGRLFSDSESDSGEGHPVVVSERLWRAKFGGERSAIGRTVLVNSHPFVLVGVMDGFRGWGDTRVGDTDVWLPIAAEKMVTGEVSGSVNSMAGRMRGSTPVAVVEQQLRGGYEGTRQALARSGGHAAFVPIAYPGLYDYNADMMREEALRLYWLLMAAVTLLFAVASANAANLLLARTCRRERDIAVRLAIGGSQWRVVRQLLVEAVGLAAVAGCLGLVTAVGLMNAFKGMNLLSWAPDLTDLSIDRRVVAFCIGMSGVTVLIFGLLPSILGSRTDIRTVLGRGGRSVTSRHRSYNALVIAQVALALTLAVGAGVLNRSLQNLFSVNLGLNPDDVIELALRPQFGDRGEDESNRIVDRTVDALREAGFVVATASPDAMNTNGSRIVVKTTNMKAPEQRTVVQIGVSPQYFEALGMPVAGRTFTEAEHRDGLNGRPQPIIVNRSLARDVFGTESVVGRTLDVAFDNDPVEPAVVIGVVSDTRSSAVRPEPLAKVYHAGCSPVWRFRTILVRSQASPVAAMARISRVVHDVDPMLPITRLRPLSDEIKESLSEDRVLARLSALVGLIATLLAAAGVHAAITQLVTERRRDFGIRAALGASAIQILAFVLRGVAARTFAGATLGLTLYWLSSQWLESRLFGVPALDLTTLVVAVVMLVAVALTAAFIPARRATRVDPAEALRAE